MKTHLTPTDPSNAPPDPKTGTAVPPEGVSVVLDKYWRRRLADGSMQVAKPKQPPPMPRPEPRELPTPKALEG